MLRLAGVHVMDIKAGYGHSRLNTTQNYLETLPNPNREQHSNLLTGFLHRTG
jgi:hypothetical protein